ncbi:MAG: hypothetical protein GC146_02515 [Limimaricola sp.]|uniref:hypothetical protein n=1 Tax=Limimaricola sp. TaxID=2211665 RepID=UPI001DD540FC|nr:hypothetical protein [Limimaricola sp.]MBI1416073.1 hypothetical protein [Limimaricola sp.]
MKFLPGIAVVAALSGSCMLPVAASADGAPILGGNPASVTYGPYARVELGAAMASFGDAYWLPPNYPTDPKVVFDLGDGHPGFGSIALGHDWMNGFRADVGLVMTGKSGLAGPWSYTDPSTPGPHADITGGAVHTTAVMASLFYSPLEQRGSSARVQPFLVGGVGFASNAVDDWTRTNFTAPRDDRTFSGATTSSFA